MYSLKCLDLIPKWARTLPSLIYNLCQNLNGKDLTVLHAFVFFFFFTNEVSNIQILTFDLKDTQQYGAQFLELQRSSYHTSAMKIK
jgi:hypothetical protein